MSVKCGIAISIRRIKQARCLFRVDPSLPKHPQSPSELALIDRRCVEFCKGSLEPTRPSLLLVAVENPLMALGVIGAITDSLSLQVVAEAESLAIDLTCAECGRSPLRGEIWRVCFADIGEAVTYCPECAEREFGESAPQEAT